MMGNFVQPTANECKHKPIHHPLAQLDIIQPMIWHDTFYKFVRLENPPQEISSLEALCQKAGVRGNILVAFEGVNGMLAGTEAQLQIFRNALNEDSRFDGMIYKRTACSKMPFKRLKVRLKKEIVPLGLGDEDVDATTKTGINLSPAAWRELLQRDDLILIDNRNSFEYEIGHFKNAIDPGINYFRHFAEYMEEHLPQWQDKPIAMYCTGGIRCEKTTAWLAEKGLKVYQLEGGILNYFAQIPDAEKDYQGSCFVFDDRRALDTKLDEVDIKPEAVSEKSRHRISP
jgi:UPF0176 protein